MKTHATRIVGFLATAITIGLAAGGLAQPIVTNGLMAYYPFIADGTDQSGNGLDLLCSNVVFTGSAATNPAVTFDGRTSYCILNQTLITRQANWTWCAWVFALDTATRRG